MRGRLTHQIVVSVSLRYANVLICARVYIYIYIYVCHTSLIFMSKLNNAIGVNRVTCRVIESDVLQKKWSDWLNLMFTG